MNKLADTVAQMVATDNARLQQRVNELENAIELANQRIAELEKDVRALDAGIDTQDAVLTVNYVAAKNRQLRRELKATMAVAEYARHAADCNPVDDGHCDCGLNQVRIARGD